MSHTVPMSWRTLSQRGGCAFSIEAGGRLDIFCRTYYNSPVNAAVSGFFKHERLVTTNYIAASKETE